MEEKKELDLARKIFKFLSEQEFASMFDSDAESPRLFREFRSHIIRILEECDCVPDECMRGTFDILLWHLWDIMVKQGIINIDEAKG